MRNPIGKPLEIQPLTADDILFGWRIQDHENKVNYDITEEPWATICAAAYTNASREPAYGEIHVIYEGPNALNTSYIENYDVISMAGRKFTDTTSFMEYLHSVDFHGYNLHIHFAGEIPDLWLRTDKFIGCGAMYLHFSGDVPQKNGLSDVTMNLTAANACVSKCCGIRIYGPVTTYVDGAIILAPHQKGMCDLFYAEDSYVIFTKLQILVNHMYGATDSFGSQFIADPEISYPSIFLAGMNSKMEFTDRFILGWAGGGLDTNRDWAHYVIMGVNYAYILFRAECEFTMRNFDADSRWGFVDKAPIMATRFALIRLSCVDKGGYKSQFLMGDGVVGCRASVNAYIDTSARMSTILNGCGLKTSKVSTQGQVVFG